MQVDWISVTTIIAAVIGGFLVWLNDKRKFEREQRIADLKDRLDNFYSPLSFHFENMRSWAKALKSSQPYAFGKDTLANKISDMNGLMRIGLRHASPKVVELWYDWQPFAVAAVEDPKVYPNLSDPDEFEKRSKQLDETIGEESKILLKQYWKETGRKMPERLPPSNQAVSRILGLGYLLLLISTIAFFGVCSYFNGTISVLPTTQLDSKDVVIHASDGRTWAEWEKEYASFWIQSGFVTVNAEHSILTALGYNFSCVPIVVKVANEEGLTYPAFEVNVLVEDESGHITGHGALALNVSATGDRVVEKTFVYNVPDSLRGEVLRIHIVSIVSTLQNPSLVDAMQLMLVRTFPMIEWGEWTEVPRILLFFLTFSTLPASTFLPFVLKKRLEEGWDRKVEKNKGVLFLTIGIALIALILYWDWVCRMFGFL